MTNPVYFYVVNYNQIIKHCLYMKNRWDTWFIGTAYYDYPLVGETFCFCPVHLSSITKVFKHNSSYILSDNFSNFFHTCLLQYKDWHIVTAVWLIIFEDVIAPIDYHKKDYTCKNILDFCWSKIAFNISIVFAINNRNAFWPV